MPHDSPPRPRARRNLVLAFGVALALALIAGLLAPTEGHDGIGGSFGFAAWFGFAACVALILVAKGVAKVLSRRGDYYGRPDD